ncbi:MAG: hypoxanthine phosphoribosyltransferase [Chloroflexota bacterium]|nr:hypoxanthine phosphoribosyltransferase [Chloroflexota bacterium]
MARGSVDSAEGDPFIPGGPSESEESPRRELMAVHQPALPLLRQTIRLPGDGEPFAHPFEQDFSRILTYYRIRWAYEPTSFTLAWSPDGRPAEMFTPDFYLPDQRLYVELTTMRQRLVTRKNRKVRRLRELYRGVQIKLLYRRDYHRLVACYRPDGASPEDGLVCRVGRVLHTEEEIRSRVTDLATVIASDATRAGEPGEGVAPDPLLVLGVGRGSETFARMLAAALRELGQPVEMDQVDLTRYRTLKGARRVRVQRCPRLDLSGRRVLVVEDVVSTGLSLCYLQAWLRRRRVETFDVCALLDRRVARLVDVPIRYAAFDAPNEVLVGCGLDLRHQFRDLPFIAALAIESNSTE